MEVTIPLRFDVGTVERVNPIGRSVAPKRPLRFRLLPRLTRKPRNNGSAVYDSRFRFNALGLFEKKTPTRFSVSFYSL